ncbi:hypothetical protein PSHT_01868, partial [Puccinia striiformis]
VATQRTPEFPTHREIRPVYRGFVRLTSKCDTTEDIRHLQSNTCDVDVKRVSLREGKMALAKLQSNLLPLLHQQLTTLLGVLDPWGLMTSQANSILQLILEMQAALEHNLDQIKVALNTLCPEESQDKSSSSGDQHNKHLKLFKLNCLDSMLTEQLFKYMQANFQEAFVLLEHRLQTCLSELALTLQLDIADFKQISTDETLLQEFPRKRLIKRANKMKAHLGSALFLVLVYYVPIIPDDDDHQPVGSSPAHNCLCFHLLFTE